MQEPPADDGVKRLMLEDHQAFFEALENPPAPKPVARHRPKACSNDWPWDRAARIFLYSIDMIKNALSLGLGHLE